MNNIAVIIPSHENPAFLRQCLQSLRKHLSGTRYEIAVVDNASREEGVVRLLDELSLEQNISVIRNSANLGYSRAVNQGIAILNQRSTDIEAYLVLNQDSQLMDDHIYVALDLMEKDSRIGLCGPRLHNGDGSVQNSFYAFPSPMKKIAQLAGMKKLGAAVRKTNFLARLFFFPSFASYYLRNYTTVMHPIEVPWITGACLLIRREALDEISGFDDNIWMYAEDMDFCFRARARGWTVVFCPDWHVCHYGGKPAYLLSDERLHAYFESLSYFYVKHLHGVKKKCMLVLNKLEKAKTLRLGRETDRNDR